MNHDPGPHDERTHREQPAGTKADSPERPAVPHDPPSEPAAESQSTAAGPADVANLAQAAPAAAPPPLPESLPAATPAATAGTGANEQGLAETLQPLLTPVWQQTQLNLGVWLPLLGSRRDRARLVRYTRRDAKVEDHWIVDLPAVCWKSGATENLRKRVYERDVRTFDNPLAVLLGGAAGFLGLVFFSWFLGQAWLLLIALFAVPIAGVVLLLRSWHETVQLSIWTTDEHADALLCPEMAIHEDELYLFLPGEQLAVAAHQALIERRRDGKLYQPRQPMPNRTESAAPIAAEDAPASPSSGGAAYQPRTHKRAELPPIKLDD